MTKFYISCKESRIENNRNFYGCFSMGPFENGQGLTIANALRRTLLSDLKGIAIVSIQIEGVLHEYSSLEGVKDSVLDILLNFKEIVLKKNTLKTYSQTINKNSQTTTGYIYPQVGYLRVRGPGIVKASDLKLPSFIEVVDPEQYIATLAPDGFLNIKFYISEGQNYMIKKHMSRSVKHDSFGNLNPKGNSIFEKRRELLKKLKNITNTNYGSQKTYFSNFRKNYENFTNSNPLNIDAVFAPVNKVNYIIENSEHKLIEKNFIYSNEIHQLLNYLKVLENSTKIPQVDSSIKEIQSQFNLISYSDETQLTQILNLKNELNSLNLITTGVSKENTKQNIIIEIWTNGSVHPKDALYQGLKQLIEIFSSLYMVPDNFSLKTMSFGSISYQLNQKNELVPLNSNSFSSIYTKLNKNALL